MKPAVKQRLVGTLVIGALALILIPLLLDGKGIEVSPGVATIPPAPVIDTTPIAEPQRPPVFTNQGSAITPGTNAEDNNTDDPADAAVTVTNTAADGADNASSADNADSRDGNSGENADGEEGAAEDADTQVTVQDESQLRLDAQGLPEAWTVRLGSFGQRRNAEALQERLIAAAHKAYLRPVGSGLTGVYVGPVPSRAEADRLQAELALAFDLSGIVQRFTVESPAVQ